MVFAAEGAELAGDAVSYRWTCDLCGHAFTTQEKLAGVADEVPCTN
jgi:hypothetical protein